MLGRTNLRMCVFDLLALRHNHLSYREVRFWWDLEEIVDASPYADAVEKHLDEITSKRPLHDL